MEFETNTQVDADADLDPDTDFEKNAQAEHYSLVGTAGAAHARADSGKTMKSAVRNGAAAVVPPVRGRRRHFQWAPPAALARAVQALH